MAVTDLEEQSSSRAQTRRFHAKQESILSAAAEVFNANGIRGGTLADVAARVGLATSSVTYYYPKRDALAAICLLRSLDAMRALISEAAEEDTVAGRVQAVFARYLDLLASIELGEHPPLMHFNDTKALSHPHSEPVFRAYVAMSGDVRRLLQGPETAHLTKAELSARSFWVLSLLLWCRLCTGPQEPSNFGFVAQRLSAVVLNGIASPTSPWPLDQDEKAFWACAASHPEVADPFLRSASMLVNEHGHRGASLDRISAELSMTKGALYRRCDNKDELMVACFQRSHLVNELAWESADDLKASGWTVLCTALRSLLWFQLSELGPTLRATATTAFPEEERQAAIRNTAKRNAQRVANLLVRGMVDGSVAPCDPTLTAQALRCLVDTSAGLPNWERTASCDNVAELLLKPALFGIFCR